MVLAARGEAERGRRITQRYCARGGGALLDDGGFEEARLADTSPHGWQFTGEGGLDVRIVPAGRSGRAVLVDSTLPDRRIFASQALQLAPGRYRLVWRVLDRGEGHKARVGVRLTCRQGAGPLLVAGPPSGDRFAAPAEVGPDCPLQWLDLAIEPGTGAVAVDDVTIARAD